jgi:hypothetical protein
MAATCSGTLTFGSVTTKPGGGGPSASRNTSSVRTDRARVGASRHLTRSPTNGGAPAATATAAACASASSTSSGRTP